MARWALIGLVVWTTAGAALAGDVSNPAAEPVVTPPPPETGISFGSDWTGPYVGLQVGRLDANADGGLEGDGGLIGLHAGYRLDFGRVVVGGEIDYDSADVDLGSGAEIDSILRGKVQAGYDFGDAFAYVTGGVAEGDGASGSDTGGFYGLGVTYRLSDRFSVSGEVLEHSFDDLGGGDTDATTVTIRGSLNF